MRIKITAVVGDSVEFEIDGDGYENKLVWSKVGGGFVVYVQPPAFVGSDEVDFDVHEQFE